LVIYLGTKLGVTEQKGLLPQIAIIPQMTVPTGSSTLTADRILSGLKVDLGWEVVSTWAEGPDFAASDAAPARVQFDVLHGALLASHSNTSTSEPTITGQGRQRDFAIAPNNRELGWRPQNFLIPTEPPRTVSAPRTRGSP
jgi:hypothetical protein